MALDIRQHLPSQTNPKDAGLMFAPRKRSGITDLKNLSPQISNQWKWMKYAINTEV